MVIILDICEPQGIIGAIAVQRFSVFLLFEAFFEIHENVGISGWVLYQILKKLEKRKNEDKFT